jgi:hypothetical protein
LVESVDIYSGVEILPAAITGHQDADTGDGGKTRANHRWFFKIQKDKQSESAAHTVIVTHSQGKLQAAMPVGRDGLA